MRWTLPHNPISSRKHPRRSGDELTHLQDLNLRILYPNSHPIPTQACASDSTCLSQLRGVTLFPSVVLTTLILVISRTATCCEPHGLTSGLLPIGVLYVECWTHPLSWTHPYGFAISKTNRTNSTSWGKFFFSIINQHAYRYQGSTWVSHPI